MTEPVRDGQTAQVESAQPQDVLELNSTLVEAVEDALQRNDGEEVRRLIQSLHDADVADLVQLLGADERRAFVQVIRPEFHPDILPEMDEQVREEVIEALERREQPKPWPTSRPTTPFMSLPNWTKRISSKS